MTRETCPPYSPHHHPETPANLPDRSATRSPKDESETLRWQWGEKEGCSIQSIILGYWHIQSSYLFEDGIQLAESTEKAETNYKLSLWND